MFGRRKQLGRWVDKALGTISSETYRHFGFIKHHRRIRFWWWILFRRSPVLAAVLVWRLFKPQRHITKCDIGIFNIKIINNEYMNIKSATTSHHPRPSVYLGCQELHRRGPALSSVGYYQPTVGWSCKRDGCSSQRVTDPTDETPWARLQFFNWFLWIPNESQKWCLYYFKEPVFKNSSNYNTRSRKSGSGETLQANAAPLQCLKFMRRQPHFASFQRHFSL